MNGPPSPSPSTGIVAEGLTVRYGRDQPVVISGQSVRVPAGAITVFVGPNGSGKSTFLKTIARQIRPETGRVLVDGEDVARIPRRDLARRIGILFQENVAPGELTVEELTEHGRYPHRGFLASPDSRDREAVDLAMRQAGVHALRHQRLSRLSAGQRQLAFLAMALAQGTSNLLLDEPTTFLDLAHQLEVMEVVRRLNRELGKTVVLVLHDINLALRVADEMIALRSGTVVAAGPPDRILTPGLVAEVFGVEARILGSRETGDLTCAPLGLLEEKPGP